MTDFGVPGRAPRWTPATDRHTLQHPIVHRALVWDLEHDKWFAALPVIVMLDDGRRLEMSWQKYDEMSITWSTIDISPAATAWVTWPLSWRLKRHTSVRADTGSTFTGSGPRHLARRRQLAGSRRRQSAMLQRLRRERIYQRSGRGW
jgi:hypothetical protein